MTSFSLKRLLNLPCILFLALTIAGGYFILHLKDYIRQGIDLVGGTMIVLAVDLKKTYEQTLQQDVSHVMQIIQEKELAAPRSKEYNGNQVTLIFENNEHAKATHEHIKKILIDTTVTREENRIIMSLDDKEQEKISTQAIKANIQALRNRLDPHGAGEILIAQQGDKIVIELPNVQDPSHARTLIGKTAYLAIRPVIDSARSEEALFEKYDGVLPEGTAIYPAEKKREWYLLTKDSELTGRYLIDAHLGYDQQNGNRAVVQFKFNNAGGNKFRIMTRESIDQQIAISVDDVVITAPVVNQEIGSEGIIQGQFTPEGAQELATLLKAGAFAAPVTFAEERVIGPSLGSDAIRQGLFACFVGLILLLIASIFVYKIAGVLAFIVLLYNLLFSLVGMWLIGATLTLSGIAGLILTIGMAVDASILIFERVREELALGRSFKNAVEIGFAGAMEVIIDANITHFIIALVLYKLGSGPLKGFAITMIVGIIATLISGIVILKGFFRYLLHTIGFSRVQI